MNPTRESPELERTPTEARQGITLGHMRYVLGISLILVVVAFAVSYLAA